MNNESMKKNNNNFPILPLLYALAGAGFVLAIFRFIISTTQQNSTIQLLDIISLLCFLAFIFLADRRIRQKKQKTATLFKECEALHKRMKLENETLKEKLAKYEERESDIVRFTSYRDKVIKRIFENKSILKDEHKFLHLLSEVFQAGAVVLYKETKPNEQFIVQASYAVPESFQPQPFMVGEGLNGQAAADGVPMKVEDLPEHFFPITSGLGSSVSASLYLLPVMKEGKCTHLFEMVTFGKDDIARLWSDLAEKMVEKGIL